MRTQNGWLYWWWSVNDVVWRLQWFVLNVNVTTMGDVATWLQKGLFQQTGSFGFLTFFLLQLVIVGWMRSSKPTTTSRKLSIMGCSEGHIVEQPSRLQKSRSKWDKSRKAACGVSYNYYSELAQKISLRQVNSPPILMPMNLRHIL